MRLRTLQLHSSEEFEVPLPFGLTSEEVEPYLRKKAPKFFEGWQKLKESYEQDPGHFFKDKSTLVLIEQIKNHVITAFATLGAPWEARLNQWLKPDCYYIVRSSGAEDGKAANAGGNLSLKYVPPEKVASSMGEVIASYFDKRSLQNQHKGGTNPFAVCPLSVTSQELIGEPMGGEKDPANIPVSAVLFSNEPLYIGGEEFRMMRLSATLGHGEGVVGNEGIATDTFIVLQSRVHPDKLYIVDNISSKPERLAPVEGKLQPLPNPRELIDAPTINKAMLQRLFNDPNIDVLKAVESFLLPFPNNHMTDFNFCTSLKHTQINITDIDWKYKLMWIATVAEESKCSSPLASLYQKILMGKEDAKIGNHTPRRMGKRILQERLACAC